jgi:hypothetical protein
MSYSSIYGADVAPTQPSGRDARLLGPSDNSDTGSDALGTYEAYGDSDSAGTGERGSVSAGDIREGADILPDHVVRASEGEDILEEDPAAQDFTDLDDSEPGEDEETG